MKIRFSYNAVVSMSTALLALIILAGLAHDAGFFKSFVPGSVTMKANTAICFLLLALASLSEQRWGRKGHALGNLLCLPVAVLCIATLVEYLKDLDLGIDQLFILDKDVSGIFPPGRPTPFTAVNFLFLTLAYAISPLKGKRAAILAQLSVTLVFFAAFQGLVGYLLTRTSLFGSAYYTRMALQTILCFILLSSGRLAQLSDRGFLQNVSSPTPSGRMTRRMLAGVAIVPPLSKLFAQWGITRGYFDNDFSQIIQTVSITSLLAIIIIAASQSMFRSESATRQNQLDLMSARQDADKANELKSAFLANMSHEIRTPLAAILGFTELLRDPDLDAAERVHYLDIILRSGDQLSIIIDDILDLSQVEAGRLTLDLTALSPNGLMNEVAAMFALKARNKGLAFIVSPDRDLAPTLTSDPVRIKQILMNLVSNALKFTEAGTIEIKASNWMEGMKRVGVVYEVRDTGIGIAKEQQDRIFDIFVQGESYITKRYGGTGLGLALSKRLASVLQGEVGILSSEIGVGTSFALRIRDQGLSHPKEAPPPHPHTIVPKRAQSTPLPLRGLNILVADDAPDNQLLICRHLKKMGATVDQAENGWVAFTKATRDEGDDIDVILMDIQMAVMDGYTATQKLRESGYAGPIIALTAHAMTESRMKSVEAGCTDFMPKPIDFASLTSKICLYTNR